MKKTTNSKPNTAQMLLDIGLTLKAVIERIEKLELRQTTHETIAIDTETYRGFRLDELAGAYLKPKPLKWTELSTFFIRWCIKDDPQGLAGLVAGQPVDIDPHDGRLTWCAKAFGYCSESCMLSVRDHQRSGAKFYAFMRSDRRITIKVGYPQ